MAGKLDTANNIVALINGLTTIYDRWLKENIDDWRESWRKSRQRRKRKEKWGV